MLDTIDEINELQNSGLLTSRLRSQSRAETMTALTNAYISLHDSAHPMMAGKVRDALTAVLAGIQQEFGPWDEIAEEDD